MRGEVAIFMVCFSVFFWEGYGVSEGYFYVVI